jgi:uncharacterized protein
MQRAQITKQLMQILLKLMLISINGGAVSWLLTHSHILAELVALALIRGLPRAKVLEFVVDLVDNPDIETLWVDEQLHREAMQLLIDRQDKGYSLCDAVSFIVMRQRGITNALTTDRHFEQEGFVRLLPPAS